MNKAFDKAKTVYKELGELYEKGDRDINNYLNLLQNHVTLKSKTGNTKNGMTTVFALGDKQYDMYNSLWNDSDYIRFMEDSAMMTYRLNDGKEYNNTMQLMGHIRGFFGE